MKKLAITLLSVAFTGGVALACPHEDAKTTEDNAPKTAEKDKAKPEDKAKAKETEKAKATENDKAKTAKPTEKPAEKKPTTDKVSSK